MKEYFKHAQANEVGKELLFKSRRDQDRDRAGLEKQKPTRRLGELPGSGKTKKPVSNQHG
jgi:hypothetical protein